MKMALGFSLTVLAFIYNRHEIRQVVKEVLHVHVHLSIWPYIELYLLVVAIDKAVALIYNYLVFIQRGFTVHCIILSEYNKYVVIYISVMHACLILVVGDISIFY